jgi:hypothetical protein
MMKVFRAFVFGAIFGVIGGAVPTIVVLNYMGDVSVTIAHLPSGAQPAPTVAPSGQTNTPPSAAATKP